MNSSTCACSGRDKFLKPYTPFSLLNKRMCIVPARKARVSSVTMFTQQPCTQRSLILIYLALCPPFIDCSGEFILFL